MLNSSLWRINLADIVKSAVVLFTTTLVQWAYAFTTSQELPTWDAFLVQLKVAGIASLGYLVKQLITGASGLILKK